MHLPLERTAKRRMKVFHPGLRRSRTFDNGKRFAEQERSTRGFGLLRQFFLMARRKAASSVEVRHISGIEQRQWSP